MTDRFFVVSWPAWISAVHPVILTSGSTDRHLFKLSCLLCPVAAIAATSKRQVYKADLQSTFDAPCLPVDSNTLLQSFSHPQRSDGAEFPEYAGQATDGGTTLERVIVSRRAW